MKNNSPEKRFITRSIKKNPPQTQEDLQFVKDFVQKNNNVEKTKTVNEDPILEVIRSITSDKDAQEWLLEKHKLNMWNKTDFGALRSQIKELKSISGSPNIKKFSSPSELFQFLKNRRIEEAEINFEGLEYQVLKSVKIGENNQHDLKILQIDNKETLQELGKNSNWCVTHDDEAYNCYSPPYLMFVLDGRPVVLANKNAGEIKEESDPPLSNPYLIDLLFPYLAEHFEELLTYPQDITENFWKALTARYKGEKDFNVINQVINDDIYSIVAVKFINKKFKEIEDLYQADKNNRPNLCGTLHKIIQTYPIYITILPYSLLKCFEYSFPLKEVFVHGFFYSSSKELLNNLALYSKKNLPILFNTLEEAAISWVNMSDHAFTFTKYIPKALRTKGVVALAQEIRDHAKESALHGKIIVNRNIEYRIKETILNSKELLNELFENVKNLLYNSMETSDWPIKGASIAEDMIIGRQFSYEQNEELDNLREEWFAKAFSNRAQKRSPSSIGGGEFCLFIFFIFAKGKSLLLFQ